MYLLNDNAGFFALSLGRPVCRCLYIFAVGIRFSGNCLEFPHIPVGAVRRHIPAIHHYMLLHVLGHDRVAVSLKLVLGELYVIGITVGNVDFLLIVPMVLADFVFVVPLLDRGVNAVGVAGFFDEYAFGAAVFPFPFVEITDSDRLILESEFELLVKLLF